MTDAEISGRLHDAAIEMERAIAAVEVMPPHPFGDLGDFEKYRLNPRYQLIARLKRLLAEWRVEVRNLEQGVDNAS